MTEPQQPDHRSWIKVRTVDGWEVTVDEPSEAVVQAVFELLGRFVRQAFDERQQRDAEREDRL